MSRRVGFGYDVHPLVTGRPLILGGVSIPYHKGLAGHSDADLVAHAIADALLGAAGLGDIGEHFPDQDPAFKNISSLLLLKEVERKLGFEKLKIVNIDVTLLLQEPKISAYKKEMIKNLANCLFLTPDQINIKATTTEALGFVGKGEGAACYAVALLEKK